MLWKNTAILDSLVEKKAMEWGTSKILTIFLLKRNFIEKEEVEKFINPTLKGFRDPFDFENMERAISKIIEKKNNNEIIFIYGDYDVDGISATAFLVHVFRKIGIKTGYYIPNRMEENYGFDKKTADFVKNKNGSLVITVDTGANSIEDIKYAKSIGIDIIVTDHHKSEKEEIDDEYILINPKISKNYKFRNLSGAGVALKLAQALYERLGIPQEILHQYLDIVMIGTVADVVPMIDENRIIIKNGLKALKNTKVNGLFYLLKYLKFQNKRITTVDVSYYISPLINSLGRIGTSKFGADFFIEDDDFKLYNIIEEMKKTNKVRRKLEKKIFDEAFSIIESYTDKREEKYIYIKSENWHPGVIGVVASRLSIKYGVPVILVAMCKDLGKASCRSSNGVNVFNILVEIKEKLIRFGGHDWAAGFVAKIDKLDEIEKSFSEKINKIDKEKEEEIIEVDTELSVNEINENLLEDIKKLSPYGLSNKQPLFLDRGIEIKTIEKFGVENRHFSGILKKADKEYSYIAFNLSNLLEKVKDLKNAKIVYYPEKSTLKGKERYNIRIKGIK